MNRIEDIWGEEVVVNIDGGEGVGGVEEDREGRRLLDGVDVKEILRIE